ncbi:MAG: hypothetical protein K1X35_02635 [Caulobacteraceae bacterium]|nr:hypothetical protein [Caulobacteraceae bacterium]
MIVWSRWGLLVPGFIILGVFAGFLVSQNLSIPLRLVSPLMCLAFAVVAGGGLFLADHKIQEGSGHVFYDPGSDKPRVIEESSGHFMFIPMKWAKFIVTAAGLSGAVWTLATGV